MYKTTTKIYVTYRTDSYVTLPISLPTEYHLVQFVKDSLLAIVPDKEISTRKDGSLLAYYKHRVPRQ